MLISRHLIKISVWIMILLVLGEGNSSNVISQDLTILPEQGIQGLAWSPDGELLAVANPAGKVTIRNVSGEILHTLNAYPNSAYTVEWMPDSHFIATGGDDNFIRIWDVTTGEMTQELEAFYGGTFALAWQPLGYQLLAAGFDTFLVWDTTTWQPIIDPVSVTILDLEWKSDGTAFAYAATPDLVGIARIENGDVNAKSFEGHLLYPYSIHWNSDNTKLISTGGRDGSVRLWDANTGELLKTLFQTDQTLRSAEFVGKDDQQVAVSTEQGKLYILDSTTGEIIQSTQKVDALLSMDWNPHYELLALGGFTLPAQQVQDATNPTQADFEATGFLEVVPFSDISVD